MHRTALRLMPLLALLAAAPAFAAPNPTPAPLPYSEPPPPLLQRVTEDAGPALTQGMKGLEFALPTSGMPTLGITYFIAPDSALRLDLGLNLIFASPDGSGAQAAFTIGLGYRLYFQRVGRLHVFAQPELTFGRQPAGTNNYEFFDIGGALGAQYFFTDHFSVGGSIGVGLNITNIGASSPQSVGVSLATTTSDLFAGFYW